MENESLQFMLDEERKNGKGIWFIIENAFPEFHFGVANKMLLINHLKDYKQENWYDLWAGVLFHLELFNYSSEEFRELTMKTKKYEQRRAKRALNGEDYLIG